MRLSELKKGQKSRVCSIQAEWDQKRRLLELGFVQGSRVEFLGRAPLCGPLIVRCRGTKIALRPSDAECIAMGEMES